MVDDSSAKTELITNFRIIELFKDALTVENYTQEKELGLFLVSWLLQLSTKLNGYQIEQLH